MNDVYVLGAGFSRWIGDTMPLMSDLAKGLPDDIRSRCTSMGLDLLLHEDRFESLVSCLYGDYPWKSEKDKHLQAPAYEDLIDYVRETVATAESSAEKNLGRADVEPLIGFWKSNPPQVITFNYDLLCEKLLDKALGTADWNEYWKLPITNVRHRTSPTVRATFLGLAEWKRSPATPTKLHGSVNWLRGHRIGAPADPLYYYFPHAIDPIVENSRQGLRPFIIPPAMDKSQYLEHDLISVLWSPAKEKLANADRVFVIGYSFPESDLNVDLLLSITMKREKKVYIINSDNRREFTEHIRSVFDRYGIAPDTSHVQAIDPIKLFAETFTR